MTKLTARDQKEMAKLQNEYNELHERMAYTNNIDYIKRLNNSMDRINDKMEAILARY